MRASSLGRRAPLAVPFAMLVAAVSASLAAGCARIAGELDVVQPDAEAGSTAAPDGSVTQEASMPADGSTEAQSEGGSADSGNDGDAARTFVCNPNQYQCAGAELQVCNPARDGWVNEQLCGSAALCAATTGTCQPTTCQAVRDCNANSIRIPAGQAQ